MAQNIFRGLGVALITPFNSDGSVDYDSLENLVKYQIESGADFFCILASGNSACAYLADDAAHVVHTFDHTVIRTILYCTIIGISDYAARFALTVYFCVVGATADIYCLTAVVSDDTAKTVRTVVCVIDFRIVCTVAYSHAERAVAVHAAYDSAHSRTFCSVVAVEVYLRTT